MSAEQNLSAVCAQAFRRDPSANAILPRHTVQAHVPATHVPARWAIVEELTKTPSMKIDRPAVIGLLGAGRGADHAA